VTLWNLPAAVEDAFEDQWLEWLDSTETWAPFFAQVGALQRGDVLQALQDFGLATGEILDAARRLRRAPEGGSIPLPAGCVLDDTTVTLLAAGFAHAERGKLAVPYLRSDS